MSESLRQCAAWADRSSAEAEDAALVERAVAGDARAYRALYDRHRPAVHRVARGFARLDHDEIEDIVQDAFVRAFSRLSALRNPGRFRPWLLAIARNGALTRAANRRAAAHALEQLGRDAERLATELSAVPEAETEAELDLVRRAIAELPHGPQRETVRLFYVEGQLTAREIADRLGVGKSAITMRLERFRSKLKRRLAAAVAGAPGGEPSP